MRNLQTSCSRPLADLVTSRDVKGYTPLHWAAYFGHEAVLELLLENEKLRESWSNDLTALMQGDSEEDGCSSTRICSSSFSPIHCAAMRGHVTCVEILLETTPVIAPSASSSSSVNPNEGKRGDDDDDDDASMDEDHAHGGGDGNAEAAPVGDLINGVKDDRGRTAMHVAAYYNHVPILQFLLGHGADVNGKDKDGLSPVMLAAANGQVGVVVASCNFYS